MLPEVERYFSEHHHMNSDFPGDREYSQRVLELIQSADILTNIYRNGVYPQWNSTGVLDATYQGEFASLVTAKLFRRLDIPLDRLLEVYLFTGGEFTGEFAANGKQNLANILGKPIQFYHQPHSEPIFNAFSREVFTPQSSG